MFHVSLEESYPYVFAAAAAVDARALSPAEQLKLIRSFAHFGPFSDEEAGSVLLRALETCEVRLSQSLSRRMQRNLPHYREKTELWLNAGLWVIREGEGGEGSDLMPEGPCVLFAFGKRSEAEVRRVAVLNSRKPGRITPGERWPKVTGRLAQEACEEGFDLVSSYGNVPYDLVSHVGSKLGAHLWVVCTDGNPFRLAEGSPPAPEFEVRADMFDHQRTTFVSPLPPCSNRFRREAAALRDRCVGTLAHEIRIAEIRAGGNMESVGRLALRQGKPIRVFVPETFAASTGGNRVLLEKESHGNVRPVEWRAGIRATKPTRAGVAGKAFTSRLDEPVLVHYTRRCHGPWPGQSLQNYLEDVLEGAEDVEHTAFQTLGRILKEGRIRAGRRLIRGPADTVSLTECDPREIRRLIRWHSALVRWSFEPYGIVFTKALLEKMGAVPAVYGDDRTYENLDETVKFRFQYLHPHRTDWSKEKEWRFKGDLDLSDISKEKMRIIVPSDQEAAVLWAEHGIERWAEEQ